MSVLIKGMEMPPEDEEIIIRISSDGMVMTEYALPITWAKAVPVPPHGDLIDANKLVELCCIMADKCDGSGVSVWHQFKTTVECSPIVIQAEEGET